MNIECSKTVFEEIILPSTESHMLLLHKCNAQIVEFNPQGTMAAIGCKYGNILILDVLSKEVVRSFNMYKCNDPEMPGANLDVDKFGVYRKINFAYQEDDFVYQQKDTSSSQNQIVPQKEEKKQSKSQIQQEDPNAYFRIEPKDKTNCKAQISHLDWSIDGRLICATFKVENVAVVWNVTTCEKVY